MSWTAAKETKSCFFGFWFSVFGLPEDDGHVYCPLYDPKGRLDAEENDQLTFQEPQSKCDATTRGMRCIVSFLLS